MEQVCGEEGWAKKKECLIKRTITKNNFDRHSTLHNKSSNMTENIFSLFGQLMDFFFTAYFAYEWKWLWRREEEEDGWEKQESHEHKRLLGLIIKTVIESITKAIEPKIERKSTQ
jgi:hypothetical protein